jgi:hypothetical protein
MADDLTGMSLHEGPCGKPGRSGNVTMSKEVNIFRNESVPQPVNNPFREMDKARPFPQDHSRMMEVFGVPAKTFSIVRR